MYFFQIKLYKYSKNELLQIPSEWLLKKGLRADANSEKC